MLKVLKETVSLMGFMHNYYSSDLNIVQSIIEFTGCLLILNSLLLGHSVYYTQLLYCQFIHSIPYFDNSWPSNQIHGFDVFHPNPSTVYSVSAGLRIIISPSSFLSIQYYILLSNMSLSPRLSSLDGRGICVTIVISTLTFQ